MQRARSLPTLALSCLLLGAPGGQADLLRVIEAAPGQPSYEAAQWHRVSNHLHSSTGIGKYKKKGLQKIFKLAKRHGVRMVMITDHNLVAHWFDELFQETDGIIPVRGMEWTSNDGHANMIDYHAEDSTDAVVPCDWEQSPTPCRDGINYQEAIEEVKARKGLVIINHPRLGRHHWPDQTWGADAVEVNGNLTDPSGQKEREWWHQRLVEGSRLTAMGGSDWHYFSPGGALEPPDHLEGHEDHHTDCEVEIAERLGWPKPAFDDAINLIRMETPTLENLRRAIQAGHVMVQKKPDSPKVFLGMDADRDGSFEEVRAGDLAPEGEGPLRFQVRVLDGKGDDLHVYLSWVNKDGGRSEEMKSVKLASEDQAVGLEVPRGLRGRSFLRAEIGSRGAVVTNPIFF